MSELYHEDDGSDSGAPNPQAPNPWTQGPKGSDAYTDDGVGDARVALSVKLVRKANPQDLKAGLLRILSSGSDEAIRDAVVMAFHARDVRGGKGERDIFHVLLEAIHEWNADLAVSLLDLIPEYGSWKDVFQLAEDVPALAAPLLRCAKAQLLRDEAALDAMPGPLRHEGDPPAPPPPSISLLAKWAPREGKAGGELAKQFARLLWVDARDPKPGPSHSRAMASYRHRLVRLNAYLKTVETYECAGRWDEIEPARVPGRAREIKKRAYLNEKIERKQAEPGELRAPADPKRMACREHFQAFFAAAAAGKARINGADTLYPHEIVRKIWKASALTEDDCNSLNATWAQMLERVGTSSLGSSVMMCDFSGSMQSSSSGDVPYFVSMAMGFLGAALAAPPFKGKFLTFDHEPSWHAVDVTKPLTAQLADLKEMRVGQGLSTDLQAAIDKILGELKRARAPPGAAPKNLIIVTDMGFDEACPSDAASRYTGARYRHAVKTEERQTHAQLIREAFRRASEDVHGDAEAWPAPRVVVWNVAATYANDNQQAQAQEQGVVLLSGWSPSLFKVLCEEGPRVVTPMEGLRAQLDAPRYDAVRARVEAWRAGGWRGVA
jgi:hypothetical protein